jgi:hypothetical protein
MQLAMKNPRQHHQRRGRITIQTLLRQQIQPAGVPLYPQMDAGRGMAARTMQAGTRQSGHETSLPFYPARARPATLTALLVSYFSFLSMPKIILQGSWSHRCRSVLTLWATTVDVLARRAIGRPQVHGWTISFEIATLFYRKQFNHAFRLDNIAQSRAYFDSLYTIAEPDLPVRGTGQHRSRAKGTLVYSRAC